MTAELPVEEAGESQRFGLAPQVSRLRGNIIAASFFRLRFAHI